MWIMHPDFGFLSIVKKPDTPAELLTVRARSRAHLEAFRGRANWQTSPIRENVGTDYAFRCEVERSVVAKAMAEAVEGIDYSNFKDENRRQGRSTSWLRALGQIWNSTYDFQENR